MNQAQKREMAIGAARSELRRQGLKPAEMSANVALVVLDDLSRVEPDLVATSWYLDASDNQVRVFKREWDNANV